MAVLVYLALFLALTGHSSATYCVCKDGVGDQQLQKTLDYACGAGADCAQILQNGPCYQPNTVKDHCNYAVNSYFQKKGQTPGSCDFSGTAITSPSPPTTVASGCSYPSTATPSTGTGTGTPTITPTTGTGTGTGTSTGTGTGTSTGTPSSILPSPPSVFGAGVGPGTSTSINDPGVAAPFKDTNSYWLFIASLTLLFSGPFYWWG